jgi:hypothetical protein
VWLRHASTIENGSGVVETATEKHQKQAKPTKQTVKTRFKG